MLNVALIGSGFVAREHALAYQALPQASLAAIINNEPKYAEKLAEEFSCSIYETLDEALKEKKIDIADVCVPTYLHERYVIQAAQAGCHVLCEKPVTFTLESFDRMTAACRENGVTFMVAQVARWWPEFISIKEHLLGEKLGKIQMIYEKRLCRLPSWTVWHRDPEKSGGGLYDLNIHDIDFLVSIYGKPKSVYAIGWKTAQGCWMHVVSNLKWENGVKAVVETCLDMPGPWPFSIEFRGSGEKGTLHYALQAGMNITDGERGSNYTWYPAGVEEPQPLTVAQSSMFRDEIEEFVLAVTQGRQPAVTLEQSRQVLEVVLATRQSLEEGISVDIM
jgi:UDP-N-acetylglucosamine 3-dehydrogenase